jgi:hypothetical protein
MKPSDYCRPVAGRIPEGVDKPGWYFNLYPEAGEAGGSFVSSRRPLRTHVPGAPAADPERSRQESARRARGRVRRYCAANGCNRLGTLTYRGHGCHDPRQLRADLGRFFRELREANGGKPFPYVWVPEWHKTDHGLHAHFALGQYIQKSVINQAWPHGFTHIKQLNDLPQGSGRTGQARKAAGYLSKYIGKAFEGPKDAHLHRFDLAQGFQPRKIRLWASSVDDFLQEAQPHVGDVIERLWDSADDPTWQRPHSMWISWAG